MSEGFTEAEVKNVAELKEWLESKINQLESEVARMREALQVVDNVLRRTSFKLAVEVSSAQNIPTVKNLVQSLAASSVGPSAPSEPKEVRQLKRSKSGSLLANAYISSNSLAIVPASDVKLSPSTPPFKSFFINRILEGMRAKDLQEINGGKLRADDALDYQVEESDDGNILKIVVRNYREKGRLDEIINSSSWVFSRMLEKSS